MTLRHPHPHLAAMPGASFTPDGGWSARGSRHDSTKGLSPASRRSQLRGPRTWSVAPRLPRALSSQSAHPATGTRATDQRAGARDFGPADKRCSGTHPPKSCSVARAIRHVTTSSDPRPPYRVRLGQDEFRTGDYAPASRGDAHIHPRAQSRRSALCRRRGTHLSLLRYVTAENGGGMTGWRGAAQLPSGRRVVPRAGAVLAARNGPRWWRGP